METRYYIDETSETLYREQTGMPNEIFSVADGWKRVVPSEEDYSHMEPISDAEAERLMAKWRAAEAPPGG